MAVPNYTYLKLKLPGPNGVISVSGSFEQSYISSREHFDLAATIANSADLDWLHATTAECRPDPGKPSQAPTFIPTEETKPVAVNDDDPTWKFKIKSPPRRRGIRSERFESSREQTTA
jgi:hypothetical protein